MNKIFNVEIDGQITLPDGRKLGPFEETTVKVVQPSECPSDPIVENAKQTGGFGYTEQGDGAVITWDGDTEGRDSFSIDDFFYYYKVSDLCPSADDVIGGNVIFDGEVETITEDNIAYGTNAYSLEQYAFVAQSDGAEVDGVTIPSAGIYFAKIRDSFIPSLTYGTPDTVHKIDEKYLPASGGVVFWVKPDPSEHDDGALRIYHDEECTQIVEIAEFNALIETYPIIWLRQPSGFNGMELGVGYIRGVIDEDGDWAGAVRKYSGECVWTAGEPD